MRKLFLLLIPIFFLLFNNVNAYNWNTPILLSTSGTTPTNITNLKAFYSNSTWFIGWQNFYQGGSATEGSFFWYSSFDNSLTNKLYGWNKFATLNYHFGDWNDYDNDNILMKIASSTDNKIEHLYISKSNLEKTSIVNSTPPFDITTIDATYYYIKIGQSKGTIVTYLSKDATSLFYQLGSSSTGFSTIYTTASDTAIKFGNIYYMPNQNKYGVLYTSTQSGNDEIYLMLFKLSGFAGTDFITRIPIATGNNYSFPTLTYLGNSYYIAYTKKDVNGTITIDQYDYANENTFNLIATETFTPSNLIGNKTIITDLTDDGTRLYLYYFMNNSKLYVLPQDIGCTCNSWQPSYKSDGTKDCYGFNLKYTRACFPSVCDLEYNYTFDSYCNVTQGGIYPELAQKTKQICNSFSCKSEWKSPTDYPSVSCYITEQLPSNLTSITTNATIQTEVIRHSWSLGTTGTNKYTLTLCNPLDNCFKADYLCESQDNITQTVNYDLYNAGEQIHSGFILSSASLCELQRKWMFDYGWQQYRVKGTMSYCGNILCGGRRCITEGILDKSVSELPNCDLNVTDKITCTSGCTDGICNELVTTVLGTGEITDIGSFIKGGTENAFKGSPWMLNLIALGVTGGITVSLYVGGLKSDKILIGIMLGCVLFFLSIQWLNPLIGILWALSLALLYTQMFRSKIIGE